MSDSVKSHFPFFFCCQKNHSLYSGGHRRNGLWWKVSRLSIFGVYTPPSDLIPNTQHEMNVNNSSFGPRTKSLDRGYNSSLVEEPGDRHVCFTGSVSLRSGRNPSIPIKTSAIFSQLLLNYVYRWFTGITAGSDLTLTVAGHNFLKHLTPTSTRATSENSIMAK